MDLELNASRKILQHRMVRGFPVRIQTVPRVREKPHGGHPQAFLNPGDKTLSSFIDYWDTVVA
jgi:hypothetical protein